MNVTTIDYHDGVNKTTKVSCKVLGYQGDITVGPFWTLGLTVEKIEEINQIYQISNDRYYYYGEKVAEIFAEKIIIGFN